MPLRLPPGTLALTATFPIDQNISFVRLRQLDWLRDLLVTLRIHDIENTLHIVEGEKGDEVHIVVIAQPLEQGVFNFQKSMLDNLDTYWLHYADKWLSRHKKAPRMLYEYYMRDPVPAQNYSEEEWSQLQAQIHQVDRRLMLRKGKLPGPAAVSL